MWRRRFQYRSPGLDMALYLAYNLQLYPPGGDQEETVVAHRQTKEIVNRLARLEGHVRAVRQMVEDGKPCPDVLIQIAAVRSALDRAGRILLEDHIASCLMDAQATGDADQGLSAIRAALKRFIS